MVNSQGPGRQLPAPCKNQSFTGCVRLIKPLASFCCHDSTQTIPTLEQGLHVASQRLFRDKSSGFLFLYRKVSKHPFGFPRGSAGKDSACDTGDLSSIPGLGRSPGERDRLPTPVFLGFPGNSAGKESACNARDLGLIPGLGISPGGGKGYPLQDSA